MVTMAASSAEKKRKASTPTPLRPPRVLRTVSPSEKQEAQARESLFPPLQKPPPTTHQTPTLSSASSAVSSSHVSAFQIKKQAKLLFPNELVQNQPHCLSAKIFAAYALTAQQKDISSTPLRTTRHSQTSKSIAPILPLLRSLVLVEAVSLASDSAINNNNHSNPSKNRRIHFSGFDCSAVQPPVDRVGGSAVFQHDSILALAQAKEQVETLVRNFGFHGENNNDAGASTAAAAAGSGGTTPTTATAIACLQALVDFLAQQPQLNGGMSSAHPAWLLECAAAVPGTFPPRRVAKAVLQYREDFLIILKRLYETKSNEQSMSYMTCDRLDSGSLTVERCLSQLVGQGIRYNLRKFFNSAPPRLTPADTNYEQREQQYSRVSSLIYMTMESEQGNAAVDDDCISALVSTALCRMYECFGLDALLSPQPPRIPLHFCAEPASQRSFAVRGSNNAVPLTPAELETVLHDIDHANAFLAAAGACRFLIGLLTAPGVQKEINRQGGWSQLETYASISWKHDLWKLYPDDAHLVVLCNAQALLQRLHCYRQYMEPVAADCKASLKALQQRFHLNTKSKNLLKKYPQISVIAQCLEEGQERALAFPVVQSRSSTTTASGD